MQLQPRALPQLHPQAQALLLLPLVLGLGHHSAPLAIVVAPVTVVMVLAMLETTSARSTHLAPAAAGLDFWSK